MTASFKIGTRWVGGDASTYIIAEMSANHGQDFEEAVAIVRAAKESGADAIKLQTYTPETLTLDCDAAPFQIGKGSLWEGRRLYELYAEASTPWEWQPKLKQIAEELEMDCFSSPFDASSVDFLEAMHVPAYKIASFEIGDLALIGKVAATGKPVIFSTGMATLLEIEGAIQAFLDAGGREFALLKCSSAYPSPPEAMNLRTIPDLAARFGVPIGLSDHTLDLAVPVAAVALGACIIEKHFTLSRAKAGPDAAFSLEPAEFKAMVEAVRTTEKALGKISYDITDAEQASRRFRRSLFVTADVEAGGELTAENVRSIRPGDGLAPKFLGQVLGRRAKAPIQRGTPLAWDLLA